MVFESLLNPTEAESKPWEAAIYAVLITTVSLGVAYYIFPQQSSLIFIFLITIACFPLIYKILMDEEQLDEQETIEFSFFERHGRAIKVYSYLFVGILAAVAFWSTFLPGEYSSVLFSQQKDTINDISTLTGAFFNPSEFLLIFLNNVKVATTAFVLSLFFGVGAIFVIAWNASIIGVFMTEMAKQSSNIFIGHINTILGIALHGVPELLGYFIAGIAGGILSMGLLKNKHNMNVIEDSLFMFASSIFILLVAAGVEAFITPAL